MGRYRASDGRVFSHASRMNILIATGIYPPDIGGPATFASIVSHELRTRGHRAHIITYGEAKNTKDVTFVSRRYLKGIRHTAYFFYVLEKGKNCDIIFSLDPVSAGVPARIAAFLLRKKFVIRIAGDYAWEQGMQRFRVTDLLDVFLDKKYGIRIELLRRIQRWVTRGAAMIIVPSEYLRSVVMRWGISSLKIRVVPNSVEAGTVVENRRKSDTLQLLSVGRMVPWKGFEMLIRLMPDLIKRGRFRLILLGDGPQFNTLKGLVERLKLVVSVEMPGLVSKEDLARYMGNSDIFLLNTAYEGFSHQIIEAMAAGLPIITTPAGGNREIIRDGGNGILAQYNNEKEWKEKILLVAGKELLRERMSEEGKKTAGEFTVDRMIEALIRELESI
jgi:glycosyltransferase involved in cell wall biosynthesis